MKTLSNEQINRLKTLMKKYLGFLAIGIGYYFWVLLTKIRIPCIFYVITDKYCPGCGITRMCMALAKFDFATAAKCNLFVMSMLPFGAYLFVYKSILYIKNGEMNTGTIEKIFYIIAFVLCVIFCILRNTEWGSFLVP